MSKPFTLSDEEETPVGGRSSWRRRLVLLALLLTFLVAVTVYWFFPRVAPVTGTRRVAGLQQAVQIRFDAYERPYVQAESLNDALFAEGWLHAQHRLWQMELFRRAAQGRLSELLGSSMLEADRELWRQGVPQCAAELDRNASADTREAVDRYVRGVNAALESGLSTAPEFLLLQSTAAPWTVRDVYSVGALMAFQSANNAKNELLRLALRDELGQEASQIFLPDDGTANDFPFVVDAGQRSIEQAMRRVAATDPLDNPLMPRLSFGSNGWVVAPFRSESGNALFAFDSHDDLGLPNLFYEVHLFFGEGKQIRGWSVAGLPGVINGFNEHVAWGFTNTGDTQDLFLETRRDTDSLQFRDGDSWYEARTETIEIPVRGRDQPDQLVVVHTRNGPLISDDPPISLSWTIQHLNGRGIDTILEFNRAASCEEFSRVLDGFAAPALNATFADTQGNIGFRTLGLIPQRGAGQGLFPLDGSDPANRWQGMVSAEDLPQSMNPDSGYLAAANARVNAEGSGPLISADNAPGYRIRRIRHVLGQANACSVQQMQQLQMDWHDPQAALLLPALLEAVDISQLEGIAVDVVPLLEGWRDQPVASRDSAAALVFQAWYRALAANVFRPVMSERLFTRLMQHNYPLNHALDRLILREPLNSWWRDDRQGLITQALQAAVDEIRDYQGNQLATWRLDRMHHVKLEHELGKAVSELAWLFNRPPEPWGGAATTVGRARYRYDRAYDVTAGATVRVVGEMASTGPRMSAVMPGGQSGHPLSEHYCDQYPSWLHGELLPISSTPSDDMGEMQVLLPIE